MPPATFATLNALAVILLLILLNCFKRCLASLSQNVYTPSNTHTHTHTHTRHTRHTGHTEKQIKVAKQDRGKEKEEKKQREICECNCTAMLDQIAVNNLSVSLPAFLSLYLMINCYVSLPAPAVAKVPKPG